MLRCSKFRLFVSYGALLASGLFLLFYNLDSHLLWGDEAETATLARNVLHYGIPRNFDGLNRITIYGAQNDSNAQGIWTWSPWLQEYLAAFGFWLFGVTTWAARAPFALIGWLSLGLMAWLAYRIYRDHRIALASLILLGTSEVFILHARQCRYYSISVLAQILFILGLYQLLSGNGRGAWTTAGALTLQFYGNYIVAAADVPVLLPVAWLLFRQNKRWVWRVVLALGLLGVAAAPWLAYARPWHQSAAIGPENHLGKILAYLQEFQFHFLPWVFFLLPLAGWTAAKRLQTSSRSDKPATGGAAERTDTQAADPSVTLAIRRLEWLLVLLIPVYTLVISVAPGRFTRYQVPLAPVACLLIAVWVFRWIRWRAAALGVLATQCICNLLAFGTAYPWRGEHKLNWTFPRIAAGITCPYTDRFADVVAFFNQEAKPSDAAFVFDPEFPLIFYTHLRIVDGRFLPGIPNPLPEWMLPESPSGVAEQVPGPLPNLLKPYYDAVTIPVHNTARHASIPDPDTYQFRTAEEQTTFRVFRKKRDPNQ